MVTVYIWNYRGKDVAWGHASLRSTEGAPAGAIYISWWPQQANRRTKIPRAPGPLANVYSVPAISGRTFADDVRDERQPPDQTILLKGLDETAIKKWWNNLLRDASARWSTLGQNCSTTVAHALEAGGGDNYAKGMSGWWRSWNTVWRPDDVARYAREIEKGLSS